MSPKEIKLIHAAANQVGFNRAQYEALLWNTAGVASCKELSQSQFEDCMAVLEDSGFRQPMPPGIAPQEDYWRSRVRQRSQFASPRFVWLIHKLFDDYRAPTRHLTFEVAGQYKLAGLVRNASRDRTEDPRQLQPREAWNLIETLKAIVARGSTTEITETTEAIHG
jgi:hypothetical protein